MPITLKLEALMAERNMTLDDLEKRVKLPPSALKKLLSGKSMGVRFSTLSMLCKALDCKPNDILEVVDGDEYQLLYRKEEWNREDDDEDEEQPRKTIGAKFKSLFRI
jgi:putative transcriptional regulator